MEVYEKLTFMDLYNTLRDKKFL